MAINRPSTLRSIDFAIVIISLAVIGTAMGCLLFITIQPRRRRDGPYASGDTCCGCRGSR